MPLMDSCPTDILRLPLGQHIAVRLVCSYNVRENRRKF